jgi:hypothetical protein
MGSQQRLPSSSRGRVAGALALLLLAPRSAPPRYDVIIDAGSTGSRAHVIAYRASPGWAPPRLDWARTAVVLRGGSSRRGTVAGPVGGFCTAPRAALELGGHRAAAHGHGSAPASRCRGGGVRSGVMQGGSSAICCLPGGFYSYYRLACTHEWIEESSRCFQQIGSIDLCSSAPIT